MREPSGSAAICSNWLSFSSGRGGRELGQTRQRLGVGQLVSEIRGQ